MILSSIDIEKAILKTLIYSDVFGWVLSKNEVFAKYQKLNIKDKKHISNIKNFEKCLNELIAKKKIGKKGDFYFLPGREPLVERRLEREKWAGKKMKIAKKIAKKLKIIPSILLAGVSGGLAVGNVSLDDDIDFFIICRRGTLWTTRFLSTLMLDILGKRRRPGDKDVRDKICLNMFVDELGMEIPKKERDLYTAHEVVQMRPLWDRGVYDRFLEENKWVRDYLPNSVKDCHGPAVPDLAMTKVCFLEKTLGWLQVKYMFNKRTREKIEAHRLMFHPDDKREWVMKEYLKRVQPSRGLNPLQGTT